jgi:hypothetical protein
MCVVRFELVAVLKTKQRWRTGGVPSPSPSVRQFWAREPLIRPAPKPLEAVMYRSGGEGV